MPLPSFTKPELFAAVANATLGWQDMVQEAFASTGWLCPEDIALMRIIKPGGSGGGGGGTTWDFVMTPLSGPSDPAGTAPAIHEDAVTRFLYIKLFSDWLEVTAAKDWTGPTPG